MVQLPMRPTDPGPQHTFHYRKSLLMPWPAAIAAAGALAGGFLGNRAGRQESRRNRRFQERMRNTAWQASVEDMKKAGLNPALAYSQGPAASPGGATATQNDVISPSVSSAMQAKRLKADLNLINQQTAKARAETESAQNTADTTRARLMSYGVDYSPTGKLLLDWGSGGLPRMTREIEAGIQLNLQRARREGILGTTMEPMAELARELGMLLPIIGGAAGAAPGLLRGIGALRSRNIFKGRTFKRR